VQKNGSKNVPKRKMLALIENDGAGMSGPKKTLKFLWGLVGCGNGSSLGHILFITMVKLEKQYNADRIVNVKKNLPRLLVAIQIRDQDLVEQIISPNDDHNLAMNRNAKWIISRRLCLVLPFLKQDLYGKMWGVSSH